MQNRREFLKLTAASALSSAAGLPARANTFEPERAEPEVLAVPSYIDASASGRTDPVGIIWVLACDISSSVDSYQGEYDAQLEAFADAVGRDDFRETLFSPGGPQSAAIFFVDFGLHSRLEIPGVDFRENNRDHFRAYAGRVQNHERRGTPSSTRHDAALRNAGVCLEYARQVGWLGENTKSCVNIMTDGAGEVEPNHEYRAILAENYGASVSSMVIEPRPSIEYTPGSSGVNVQNWCARDLTTPGNTFIGPNGQLVPAGMTEKVAEEMETRGQATARFKNNTFMMMRRQITSRTAWRQLEPTHHRFA